MRHIPYLSLALGLSAFVSPVAAHVERGADAGAPRYDRLSEELRRTRAEAPDAVARVWRPPAPARAVPAR